MANSYFSYENHVDSGTLTTDSEVENLSVTNLQNTIIQVKWRTDGTTSAYFQVDFGSNKSVDLLGLVIPRRGIMIGSSDTVRHRLDADGGTAGAGAVLDTSTISSDIASGYGYHYYKTSATLTARYWKCDINASSLSSNNYFQIGRAWAGEVVQPDIGLNFGVNRSWQDGSVISRARRSGALYVDIGEALRRWSFQFVDLTNLEAQDIEEMQRIIGRRKQIFMVRTTDEMPTGRRAIIGRLSSLNPITQPNFNQASVAFDLVEDQ